MSPSAAGATHSVCPGAVAVNLLVNKLSPPSSLRFAAARRPPWSWVSIVTAVSRASMAADSTTSCSPGWSKATLSAAKSGFCTS
jgi:hypothetical protein